MRVVTTAILSVAATALTFAPAAAAPPGPVDSEPVAIEGACDFTVESVLTGKFKIIEHGDTSIYVAPNQKITLTNPENGKTATYVITGSFHDEVQPDGSIVSKAVGKNLLWGPGVQGLLLTTGNVTVIVTGPYSEDYMLSLQSSRGSIVDVCDVLE